MAKVGAGPARSPLTMARRSRKAVATPLRAQSLPAFLRTVADIKTAWLRYWDQEVDPWFRGVSNAGYSLVPGAYRIDGSDFDEDDYRDQFALRAFPYLSNVLVRPTTDWDWYFVMQHYGLPTRLLDWTEAAGVALYFAVREQKPTDAAVWMLDPFYLNGKVAGIADYIFNTTEARAERYLKPAFARRALPERPVAIQPPFHSYRITSQKGMFTIHGSRRQGLEAYRSFKDHLVRITIPRAAVPRMKAELMTMGITETTVFPELEALGRELLYSLGAPNLVAVAQARQAASRGSDVER
jgi:hypothetical protein